MIAPVLTALYVPADRPDRVQKALRAGADAVIIDLEDAVAPTAKDAARSTLPQLAQWAADADSSGAPQLQVRVNPRGSAWHDSDLDAIAALPGTIAVRVPKVGGPEDVAAVAERLPGRDIHPLLESALAIERAFEIASAPRVAGISTGEADLRAELGVTDERGLLWSRSRVVNAAAAAGLPAPLLSVFADVADLDGLARSCAEGRALGFGGRTAIHPRQLPVIRRAFTPTDDEVTRAAEVIARVGSAAADGTGTVVLDDGTFLDVAMVRAARRVLAIAGRSA